MKKKKLNCWEVMGCENSEYCPARNEQNPILNGLHGGEKAGRCCWIVSEHLCSDKEHFKCSKCYDCPFYNQVKQEEGEYFQEIEDIFKKLFKFFHLG